MSTTKTQSRKLHKQRGYVTLYKITNWASRQSFRSKKPPWIKLHTSLLDDHSFHAMSLDAKHLLPMLWMLATESNNPKDGIVKLSIEKICWRLRRNDVNTVAVAMNECISNGFIEGKQRDIQSGNRSVTSGCKVVTDTKPICYTEESRGETETEKRKKEKEQKEKWKILYDLYPQVGVAKGSFPKFYDQVKTHLKKGVNYDDIKTGIQCYEKYCTSGDIYNSAAWRWIRDEGWKNHYPTTAHTTEQFTGRKGKGEFSKKLAIAEKIIQENEQFRGSNVDYATDNG